MGGLKRRVLKFGGTSVGTAGALRSALEIAETAARERPVVVVVSALSGVTNALEVAMAGAGVSRLDIAGLPGPIREPRCLRELRGRPRRGLQPRVPHRLAYRTCARTGRRS